MKKILLSLASFITVAFTSNAQLINPNFSTWNAWSELGCTETDPNGGIGTTGWWDFNLLNCSFTGASPVSVTKNSTTVYTGDTYSAEIVSVALTTTSWDDVKAYGLLDTMGVLMTANVSVSTSVKVTTGEPFTQRISSFTFEYQYTPNGTDTASCTVALYHYSGGKRNTIGGGTFTTSTATSSWTLGTVNIKYDSGWSSMPDTIFVEFSATSLYSKPKAGSILLVDNTNTVDDAINEISSPSANVKVYPNPATDEINFSITGSAQVNYAKVYDITGQKVSSFEVNNNFATLQTKYLAQGLYFYQLYDKSGNALKMGKFSVLR